MNINSTVISGYQALNDLSYLLQDKQKALLVTDKNILGIPAVQALIARLQQQIASLSLVDTVPPALAAAAYWMWRSCCPCYAWPMRQP